MDTSCCSLSVSGLFQHSSNKGNRPCCKLPFNHDIALASFTGISCDKASFCRTHIITALPVTRTYRPSQTHKKILLQEPLLILHILLSAHKRSFPPLYGLNDSKSGLIS